MPVQEFLFTVDPRTDKNLSSINEQLRSLTNREDPLTLDNYISFDVIGYDGLRSVVIRVTMEVNSFYARTTFPVNGAAFSQTAAPQAIKLVFNSKVDESSIVDTSIKYNETNVLASSVTLESDGYTLSVDTSGLSYNALQTHTIELISLKDRKGNSLSKQDVFSYVVGTSGSATSDRGNPEPYTYHDKVGDFRVTSFVIDRYAKIADKITEYLKTNNIDRNSVIAQDVLNVNEHTLEVYILYFSDLFPSVIRTFPQEGALVSSDGVPTEAVITLSQPTHINITEANNITLDGIDLSASGTLSDDNRTLRVNVSGKVTAGSHFLKIENLYNELGRVRPNPPIAIGFTASDIAANTGAGGGGGVAATGITGIAMPDGGTQIDGVNNPLITMSGGDAFISVSGVSASEIAINFDSSQITFPPGHVDTSIFDSPGAVISDGDGTITITGTLDGYVSDIAISGAQIQNTTFAMGTTGTVSVTGIAQNVVQNLETDLAARATGAQFDALSGEFNTFTSDFSTEGIVISDGDGSVTVTGTANNYVSGVTLTGDNLVADVTILPGAIGNLQVSHQNIPDATSVDNNGDTVVQDILTDSFGHVTGQNSYTITPPIIGALGTGDLDSGGFLRTDGTGSIDEIVATSKYYDSGTVDLISGALFSGYTGADSALSGVLQPQINTNDTDISNIYNTLDGGTGAGVLYIASGDGVSKFNNDANYWTVHSGVTNAITGLAGTNNNFIQAVTSDSNGHLIGIVANPVTPPIIGALDTGDLSSSGAVISQGDGSISITGTLDAYISNINITGENISGVVSIAPGGTGNIVVTGFSAGITEETDPIFTSSVAYDITVTNLVQWSAGYTHSTGTDVNPHGVSIGNISGGTFAQLDTAITNADLVKSGDNVSYFANDAEYAATFIELNDTPISVASGQIFYASGTDLLALESGVAGYYLQQGADFPQWAEVADPPVISVNGEVGEVLLSGSHIEASHVPTHYTATDTTVSGHFSGVDTAIGANAAGIATNTTDINIVSGIAVNKDNYHRWHASDGSTSGSIASEDVLTVTGTNDTVVSYSNITDTFTINTPVRADTGLSYVTTAAEASLGNETVLAAGSGLSLANATFTASGIELGGVSATLGVADLTPAFDLADATNYPSSGLVGEAAASGAFLYSSGTAWVELAAAASGSFLKTQGDNDAPTWVDITPGSIGLTAGTGLNLIGGNTINASGITITPGSGIANGGDVNLGGSVTLDIDVGGVTNTMLESSNITVHAGTGVLVTDSPVYLGGSTTIHISGSTTGAPGIVQLQDSATDGTTTRAITPNAVYDISGVLSNDIAQTGQINADAIAALNFIDLDDTTPAIAAGDVFYVTGDKVTGLVTGAGASNTGKFLQQGPDGYIRWDTPAGASSYDYWTMSGAGGGVSSNIETTDTINYSGAGNVTVTLVSGDPNQLTISGTAHPTIAAASSMNNNDPYYVQDITLDSNGHVTALVSGEVTPGGIGAALASHTHVLADLPDVSDQTILGNIAGSTGPIGVLSATNVRTIIGVEAGATADQTASEIRALVESAADSHVFTTDDHAKLDGIATNANNYTLPAASGTTLGGVKDDVGSDVTITAGVITVDDDSHSHVLSNIDELPSSVTRGDILYGNVSARYSNLAIGSAGSFLKSVSSLPSWADITFSDVNISSFSNGDILFVSGGEVDGVASGNNPNKYLRQSTEGYPFWDTVTTEGGLPNPGLSNAGSLLYWDGSDWVALDPPNSVDHVLISTGASSTTPYWTGMVEKLTGSSGWLNSSQLSDIGDINYVALSAGHILYYGGVNWANASLASLAESSISLNTLNNVTENSTDTGSILINSGGEWIELDAANSGYVLETRGTAAMPAWVEAGGGGATGLGELDDVTITNVSGMDSLVWDTSVSKFVNRHIHLFEHDFQSESFTLADSIHGNTITDDVDDTYTYPVIDYKEYNTNIIEPGYESTIEEVHVHMSKGGVNLTLFQSIDYSVYPISVTGGVHTTGSVLATGNIAPTPPGSSTIAIDSPTIINPFTGDNIYLKLVPETGHYINAVSDLANYYQQIHIDYIGIESTIKNLNPADLPGGSTANMPKNFNHGDLSDVFFNKTATGDQTISGSLIIPAGKTLTVTKTPGSTLDAANKTYVDTLGDTKAALVDFNAHTASGTVHFTEGSIDHTAITGIGTNTHAQIDTHLSSTANPHATDIGNLGAGTLAELNTAVTDATLDNSSASRPPNGSAGGDLGGTYPNPTVDDGADGTAIHDNVAAEISSLTEKTTPVSADLLIIEDSAALHSKKKVQIGNLPSGGGGSTDLTPAEAFAWFIG